MLDRRSFLKSTSAAFLSGGLDVWSPPGGPNAAQMRVLIAAGKNLDRPALADGAIFTYRGRRYRGVPSTIVLPDGRAGIVATIDVDEYLYGVLPVEASPRWPHEALAAQAIVSRTFALGRRMPQRPYDIVASVGDQEFGGIEAEYPSTNAAVDDTHAAIVKYAGLRASVFFGSCCGGHTADAAQIWAHEALPYLRGVPDPYCALAPDYRWQRVVPLAAVQAALGAEIAGAITGFALGPPDDDGRPLEIDILAGDARASLTPERFRARLGADIVRSTWIRTLAVQPGAVVIEGAGRGHGVGMCQWGARAMGEAGRSAADIVAFYFPGTTIGSSDGA